MERHFIAMSLLFVGGALLALAGCGQSPPAEDAMAEPAGLANGSFTVELAGHQLHYEVHGSGPVLMTLPNSWGLSLAGLRNMYRPLEDRVTMVYFDPRGLGGSGPVASPGDMGLAAVREDFHALREHLGLQQVDAIGWSNGAMNLILLAAERPEKVSAAIFVHGVASFGPEDMAQMGAKYPELMQRWTGNERELADEALTDVERTGRMKQFWLDEYFPSAVADPDAGAAAVRAAFEPAEFSWPHAQYTQQESPSFDARDRLPAIGVRSLVIAGAADMSPPAKVQELADGLPNAEFVVFDASGHFSPLEEPARFKQIVLDFLAGTP